MRYLALSFLVLLLAGCGNNANGGRDDGSSSTVSDALQPAFPSAPNPAGPQPSPEVAPVVAVAVVPGAVTITPERSGFGTGSTVRAVLANGLGEPIYVEDLHSGCTVAVLEIREQDGWARWPDCGSERLPRTLAVDPGLGLPIDIDPVSLEDTGRLLTPGTYRISVGWRSTPEPAGQVDQVAYSDPFEIG